MSPGNLWAAVDVSRALVAGLLATTVMTTLMSGSQGLGLSRMSLPFLLARSSPRTETAPTSPVSASIS